MIRSKIQFKLINNDTGQELKLSWDGDMDASRPAPKNWETCERRLKRSTKTFGIFTELSRDLEFTKKGADFLESAYRLKDIEANVVLEEYRQHPHEDGYYLNSTGVFDFSEYSKEENTVKVPFKTGGLNTILQSQFGEPFRLDRTEALTGDDIGELVKRVAALTSRRILLISKLETPEVSRTIPLGSNQFNVYGAMPNLDVVSNSDQENVQATFIENETYWISAGITSEVVASENELFYFNSDVAKTVKVRIRVKFRARKPGTLTTEYAAKLYRYNFDGINLNYVDNTTFVSLPYQLSSFWVVHDQEYEIDLNAGDCLRIGFVCGFGGGTATSSQAVFELGEFYSVSITEDSIREDSNTDCVLFHEIGDRLMKILTGENNRYYSEFYGRAELPQYTQTGTFAYSALALGLWIRGFNDESLEVSIKDFIEISNGIHNTSYTIDEINGREMLIHEDLKYFFQDFCAIKIPTQVTNIKRGPAKDLRYANTKFGYKEGGDYEEAMGLDEFNVRSGWTLPITRVDSKYDKEVPARADSYGKEFARRKPKLNYPEEDTRYDRHAFILDLKTGDGDALLERVWQDDYEVQPYGVYSPDTATGLRLTPFRVMERHEWFLKSGLYKFPGKKMRFSNGPGNTELVTQKLNEVERQENTSKDISELKEHRFIADWIEFDAPVDYDLMQQVTGKTVNAAGRLVKNYFGKVEFINEFGLKEYGYLFEFSQKDQGKWKLLKARD